MFPLRKRRSSGSGKEEQKEDGGRAVLLLLTTEIASLSLVFSAKAELCRVEVVEL